MAHFVKSDILQEAITYWEDIRDYVNIRNQIENQRKIVFGRDINVLLFTDRLYGCAKGLHEYFLNSVDIVVELVDKLEDAKQIINTKSLDFLIIVGYLKTKANYCAVQAIKEINNDAKVIMFASIDFEIERECKSIGIYYKYNRLLPIDHFVEYMRQLYTTETIWLKSNIEDNILLPEEIIKASNEMKEKQERPYLSLIWLCLLVIIWGLSIFFRFYVLKLL